MSIVQILITGPDWMSWRSCVYDDARENNLMTAWLPAALRYGTMAIVLLTLGSSSRVVAQDTRETVPSPEQFFGFQMGADRKLANWDKLHDYYQLLAKGSTRIRLVELGKSSEGRPYIALFISSPANLASLDHYKQLNARLADPRGLSEPEAKKLVAEARAVVVQSFALHSSEVAASQTAAEFVYDSLTRNDEEAQRILDNVISIVAPSINPDGTQMIADWYMKYVGTAHEAAGLPWLYQKYVGPRQQSRRLCPEPARIAASGTADVSRVDAAGLCRPSPDG